MCFFVGCKKAFILSIITGASAGIGILQISTVIWGQTQGSVPSKQQFTLQATLKKSTIPLLPDAPHPVFPFSSFILPPSSFNFPPSSFNIPFVLENQRFIEKV
jgi:hypothetical protein